MLNGIGASKGIAIAQALVVKPCAMVFEKVSKLSVEEENKRFTDAIDQFVVDTKNLMAVMAENVGEKEAEILQAHIIMAQDPEIISNVEDEIKSGKTAEAGVDCVLDMFQNLFRQMGDELMAQRASDLGDIRIRLLQILTDVKPASLSDIAVKSIIVTHDLTPSDTGKMNKEMVEGVLTEVGGMTSHTAIIARAMEIPAVLGIDNVCSLVKDGDIIILNSVSGEIIINPTEKELEGAKKVKEELEDAKAALEAFKNKPTKTADGIQVELCANIGRISDLERVLSNTAEGVGLFRTEFLFMDRNDVPSEEEQFKIYKEVAETMQGKPVIIRTLDIGGDKEIPYLDMPKEDNPFLGYRAVRLCLDRKDLFKPQLRALLRASAFGKIKIMIPMISCVDELRQSKQLIEEMKKELLEEKIEYDKNIQVGIMIETPAASLISDLLAKECDFFSIGTNDLTQYTMAVDRGNKKVSYLYQTFNPAVIRSIATIIKNGKKENIMVGMCGEAAGDPLMIPFLLAAGLDEFSMTASQVLSTRKLISTLNKKELELELDEILSLATPEEIKDYLSKLI